MPKVVDHEGRRREIAEAVRRTVARRGIEATTVRDIAEEAGCSTGVLAHYFDGKDALILHALNVSIESAVERMEERSRRVGGTEALRAILKEALPLDEERRAEWRVWLGFWGRAANSAALKEVQRRRYDLWRAAVQSLLEEGQREGAVAPNLDVVREATSLVALVDGIGIQATFEPDRLSPKEQIAHLDRYLSRLAGGSVSTL